MQVSSSMSRTAGGTATISKYGLVQTGMEILQRDGVAAMYTGLSPALVRQALYGGLSVGSYQPVLRFLFAPPSASDEWARAGGGATFGQKFVAGALAGGVAQLVTSPTDTIRIRMQADRRNLIMHQVPVRYRSMRHAFSKIIRNEGVVHGLFVGASVNTARAAIMNSLWMSSYDQSKSELLNRGALSDGPFMHAVCSQISGVAAALIAAPMDNVRTLMISQYQSAPPSIRRAITSSVIPPSIKFTSLSAISSSPLSRSSTLSSLSPLTSAATPLAIHTHSVLVSPPVAAVAAAAISAPVVPSLTVAAPTVHRSALSCFRFIFATDGVAGLYRGFVPSVIRGNLWSLSFFLLFENVYKFMFGTHF